MRQAVPLLLVDASSLRHLATAGALHLLHQLASRVIVVDLVALALAADLDLPGARDAHDWIVAGTSPGSSTPIEIAITETGSLLRLARQVDPQISAANASRRAIVDWLGEYFENGGETTIVVCEDRRLTRGIVGDANAVVMTAVQVLSACSFPAAQKN